MKNVAYHPMPSTQRELSGHPVEPTAEAAARRLQLLGKRLAIPVAPLEGEGLPDLYHRAIRRNGEEFASTLWHFFAGFNKPEFSHRNFVDLRVSDETFANFLGTPLGAADIAPLRYRRLSSGLVSFFGRTIKLSSLSQQRRVSPRFLAEFGYQKAIWSLLPIAFDPSNHEYLMSRCPVCQADLTFARSLGLSFCHACVSADGQGVVNFEDFPQDIVQLESYENIDFACSLIDPALDETRDATRILHPDLRSVGRGQIFEFIVLIGRLLDKAEGLTESSVTPAHLDVATGAVRAWPRGFIEISERIRDVWRFPTRQQGRGYKHPVYGEVRAFRRLFGHSFGAMVRSQLRGGGRATDEPRDDVSTDRIARFRRPHPRTTRPGGFDTESDKERLEFASLLARSSRGVKDEARRTGLPVIEMIRLYEEGLALCPDPGVSCHLRPKRVAKSDVISAILSRSETQTGSVGTLYNLVTCLSGGKVCWPQVLTSALSGNLAFGVEQGNLPIIRRMTVADVDGLLRNLAHSAEGEWSDDVILTNADAGFYLGVTEHEVASLVTKHMLPSNGIRFSVLQAFRAKLVCGSETLRLLEFHDYPLKGRAVTFRKISEAGAEPICTRPSVRNRVAVSSYLRSLGHR
ncbi:hypothetical protein [Rhizobium laguerreae]|uniref:hypothetical protein n=1 Tax=Rhizobium laguerreae TaxID=1076926 RepID=UPI001C8FAD23|nr:hypothetical protein [Rhizobium laguerreae]MBY3568950.1 hypothetical protein [Rhizobium laguerreae]